MKSLEYVVGRISKINVHQKFDSVMLVLTYGDVQVHEIWEAERQDVIERLIVPGSKARNERFSMSVPQFRSVATRVWPK